MKRPATRVVKLVKSGNYSSDDLLEIFFSPATLKNLSELEKSRFYLLVNVMAEVVREGKFDLRKMQ